MREKEVIVVGRKNIVSFIKNDLKIEGRRIKKRNNIIRVKEDMENIEGIMEKIMNDIGIIRKRLSKGFGVVDSVSKREEGVIKEKLKMDKKIVGERGNIMRGWKKIVKGRRIGVNKRESVLIRRISKKVRIIKKEEFKLDIRM